MDDLISREFEEIVVEYPNITDEEHKGKPYYSIKYIENGEDKIIGFGTYKIEVLSRYIRDYFIQSVQPELAKNSKELENKNGELISRQAAIKAIEEMQKPIMRSNFSHEQFIFRGMSEARQAIIDLASVQPEIIRCKDCKWFNKLGCAIWIKDDSDKPTENDYCSFAEKRGDSDED